MERVWTHWLSARLAEQERIAAAQSQQRQSSGMTSAHTTRTSSSNNMLKIEQGVAISDAAVEAAATIATTVAAITSSKSATAQTDTTSEDPVKTNPQVSVMVDEDTAWMRQPVSEDFAESEWESTDFGNSNNDKINQNDGEVAKCVSGVTTKVRGISSILSAEQIQKLEEVCYYFPFCKVSAPLMLLVLCCSRLYQLHISVMTGIWFTGKSSAYFMSISILRVCCILGWQLTGRTFRLL